VCTFVVGATGVVFAKEVRDARRPAGNRHQKNRSVLSDSVVTAVVRNHFVTGPSILMMEWTSSKIL